MVKSLLAMQETQGSTPGSGRSPGEGNGNPLQYSFLENSMDRGACKATVHEVTKNRTQLILHQNMTAVIILPHISVSNQHSIHLKIIQCYLSIISQFKKKKRMRGSIKLTWIWENRNYCFLIFYMSLEVQSPGANLLVPEVCGIFTE